MDRLDAWLAEMPVSEVDQRIAEYERQLVFLKALRTARIAASSAAPTPAAQTALAHPVFPVTNPATPPLSRERELIVQFIREQDDGVASPRMVGEALRSQGIDVRDNAVQTTMSRMVKARQLVRNGRKGYYKLPPETATLALVNGSGGGEAA
jgi:hypothetical protein